MSPEVLNEVSDIDGDPNFVRPISVNLAGILLARPAHGLPRNYPPGSLIRGFITQTLTAKSIRFIAPSVLPHMISPTITKQPRTIQQLAEITGNPEETIRGCLAELARPETGLVRPLDRDQDTWEISHDSLVRLIHSVLLGNSSRLWPKARPWLPWMLVTAMTVALCILPLSSTDPAWRLTGLGWQLSRWGREGFTLRAHGNAQFETSAAYMLRLTGPLAVSVDDISGIEALSKLNHLTKLTISGTRTTNLSAAGRLLNLTDLSVSGLPVSDISPLASLVNLSRLDLSGTRVVNLSALSKLTKLQVLDLHRAPVADLSPLSQSLSLTELYLSDSQVSGLSPLRNLSNLRTLDLTAAPVSTVSPLSQLINLSVLNLENTKVTDITPLTGLSHLTWLNLRNTRVSTVAHLRALIGLQTLDVRGTAIKDIPSLGVNAGLKVWKDR